MSQGIPATLLAVTSNRKRYAGLLLLAVAFVSETAFRFFDAKAGDPLDYWNAHYFLYSAGPHISGLLTATGFFFLLHEKLRFWAVLPGAYKLAKIIWLAFVSTNAQLHQFVPFAFLLIGLSASLLWFMSFDYLMGLHFHKFNGSIARLMGIINSPGIDDSSKVIHMKTELENLKSIQKL